VRGRKKSGIFVSGVFSWINKPKKDKAAAAAAAKAVADDASSAAAGSGLERTARPGESVMDGLEIIKCVGKGAFGKVLLVRSKEDDSLFALKILSIQHVIDKKQVEHTITERKIMVQIEHPFIAKLRFTFMAEGKLYFGMDFYAGGPLFYHLQ
jgi:serum/glucocorticoid-regulated kinase 2